MTGKLCSTHGEVRNAYRSSVIKMKRLLRIADIHVEERIIFVSIGTGRNRDSAVGIPTGYGLDDRGVGVRVPVG
jgi:hypothetical protein